MTGAAALTLEKGLSSEKLGAYRALMSDLSGLACGAPFLAPTHFLADPAVRQRLPLPVPTEGRVLVHEAQTISANDILEPDAPVTVTTARDENGALTRLTCHLRQGHRAIEFDTALRCLPVQELRDARPQTLRDPDRLFDMGVSRMFAIPQGAVDTYLAISGDTNPLHVGGAQVDALGLGAPLVPGLLLLGLAQPFLTAFLPGRIARLSARFVAPLPVGAELRIGFQRRGQLDGAARVRAFFADQSERSLAIADLRVFP